MLSPESRLVELWPLLLAFGIGGLVWFMFQHGNVFSTFGGGGSNVTLILLDYDNIMYVLR
jgi:hypothetical protein